MRAASLDRMFDIGPYIAGEEAAILDCMRECFGFARDPESWRHFSLRNPAGESIIAVARAGDLVVSFRCLSPRRIRAFGREGLAGHSVWLMTRPAWRRAGLGRTLGDRLEKIARDRGFLVTYGFNNDQSLHGSFKYQHRRPVRLLPLMVRPLRPLHALCHLVRRTSSPDRPPLEPSGWTPPAFDDRHSALFAEADALPPIAIVRDASYLTWRYPPRPTSPYRQRDILAGSGLAATIVVHHAVRAGLQIAFVMEWLWAHGRRGEGLGLMREALRVAREGGAVAAAALAMPGTPQRRLLHRLGFVGIPGILFPERVTLAVRPECEGGEAERWFRPASWYLTFGDGDVV